MSDGLESRIAEYLGALCQRYPDRHVGGPGNHAATGLCFEVLMDLGWDVSRVEFDCLDWEAGAASLEAGGSRFEAHPGPYSLSADVRAPLVAVDSTEALESADIAGALVLIHGEAASGALMPRDFVFYNPESHQRVYRALEAGAPAAIVAATGRDPSLAGGAYPFPLIEDGGFDIPHAYMRDTEGERLLAHAGASARLAFDAARLPRKGEHVIARRQGERPGKVVVFGHVDTKPKTPGALDNATGVAMLLALAELLRDHRKGPTVELVPTNGEDYYAASGEMIWVAENTDAAEMVELGINADAMGCAGQLTNVSLYGCPEHIDAAVRTAMADHPGIVEGPAWYQGDHGVVMWMRRPAVALTSANFAELTAQVTHTERDTIELTDPAIVAEAARFCRDVIARL